MNLLPQHECESWILAIANTVPTPTLAETQENKSFLKQVKPPEFDGKGKDIEAEAEIWVESMKDYFTAAGIAPSNQAMIAKLKLTGEARLWWK